jgi:GxxExxY protein
MNTNEQNEQLIERVVGCVYEVANILGAGFSEVLYERALLKEFELRGISAQSQVRFPVFYKGRRVGDYVPDLLIEKQLLLELKCVECFCNEHLAQCLNYLRASHLHLALLVNFQHPKVEWRRVILD